MRRRRVYGLSTQGIPELRTQILQDDDQAKCMDGIKLTKRAMVGTNKLKATR